jgi:hypothetical protein
MRLTLGLVIALAAMGAEAAHAETWALKDFQLGAAMPSCPAGTIDQKKSLGGSQLCMLGATTLANQPAKSVLLSAYDGRLYSVMLSLAAHLAGSMRTASCSMRSRKSSALRRLEKPRLNEAEWRNGTQILHFDGVAGIVILSDIEVENKVRSQGASGNKKDL